MIKVALIAFASIAAPSCVICGTTKQVDITRLLVDLRSSEWSTVGKAADQLEELGASAIPGLLKLTQSTDETALVNTADLIYPGASKFYGHGGVVRYALNHVALRAGWVIERITFRNFGFREELPDTCLAARDKEERIPPDSNTVGLSDFAVTILESPLPANRARRAHRASLRATVWWQTASPNWTRLRALAEGLSSSCTTEQADAIQYLRFHRRGRGFLTAAQYEQVMLPLVRRLASSPHPEVRNQAQFLTGQRAYERPRRH